MSELATLCTVVLLVACAGTSSREQIRVQFANDHHCPESQVKVVSEGPKVLRATGCGIEQSYVCVDGPAREEAPHNAEGQETEFRYQSAECSLWTKR